MTDLKVPSGANVVINAAPFKDAKNLQKAIMKEMANVGKFDLSTLLYVLSSESVDNALWPCLARCTYNDEKITEQTFDKLENRRDFGSVIEACTTENLGPLFESLLLKLSEYGMKRTENAPK